MTGSGSAFVCLFTTTSIAHVLYTIVHSAIYGRALVYTLGARWGEKMTWKKVKNWSEKLSHLSPFDLKIRSENSRKYYLKNRCGNAKIWCEFGRQPLSCSETTSLVSTGLQVICLFVASYPIRFTCVNGAIFWSSCFSYFIIPFCWKVDIIFSWSSWQLLPFHHFENLLLLLNYYWDRILFLFF